MDNLQTTLAELGFILIRKNKHFIYRHTNGQQLVVSNSSSDHRATENVLADARKIAGVSKPKRSFKVRTKNWTPSDERQLRDFAEDLGITMTHKQAEIWLKRYNKEARKSLIRLAEISR